MSLRKGRTKTILESAIDCALLAVEVYNKPRTAFRVENYVSLMIMAWTRLFHAYFNNTIGNKYYYKKGNRYEKVDGERKAWDLSYCIKKYGKLSKAEKENLRFFIKLRNKIEHRHIEKETLDTLIFGECQALLYNFENTLVKLFGEEYSINENLAFSLQFSRVITKEQKLAQKNLLSNEVKNIVEFINKYRNDLNDDVFNSQEYSVKLIAIPKVTSASRNDLAVEFLNWDSLTLEEQKEVQRLTTIVKNKVIKIEGVNTGRYKPGCVVKKIREKGIKDFNMNHHTNFWKLFKVRPPSTADDPFDTNTTYCYYDEAHKDYLYTDAWIELIANVLIKKKIMLEGLYNIISEGKTYDPKEFRH